MKRNLRVVRMVPWLLVVYALWSFLGALWAPDVCLDVLHGSFDYRAWECSDEQQPYVATPLYDVPGFWLLLGSVLVAIAAEVVVSRAEAQRGKVGL